MDALVCVKPGMFEYTTMSEPELRSGYSIVKIKNIGVCGTDLHAYRGTQPYFSYPRILGHELSGELVDIGDARGFEKGELVTFIPYFNCGHCLACKTGKPNCCVNIKVCGVHIDGGMVEYLAVPSYSLVHGEGLTGYELAMVEPLAIGAHGIKRAQVHPDEFVLVMGAGPIGLGTMKFARLQGAKVIALDINEGRLSFCIEKGLADYKLNAAEDNVAQKLSEITNGEMAPVVIDATGNQKAINSGLNYLGHGGRYILIGLQKGDLIFSHPEFHKRESTLMSSRNATREDFNYVISCMKQGKIDTSLFITDRVKFRETNNNFVKWLDPANGTIKAIIEMV